MRSAPAWVRLPYEDCAIASTFDSRRLSYAALMAAAGLAGVYAETIPNFEVLTLTTFCAGVLLGARDGALVGGVTMLLYTLLNPYGPAHPLVMAAQVIGTATAGVAGGLYARAGAERWPVPVQLVLLGLSGATLTAWFDLLTNLATGVLYGQMRATLIGGMLFATWHIVTNLVLFTAVGGALVRVLSHYRARLSPQRSLIAAPAARAEPAAGAADVRASGAPDPLSWWAEPGRGPFAPWVWLATAPPPSFAGHVAGGITVVSPLRAPFAMPLPGVAAARSAAAFHDSLAEAPLSDPAWRGFDGTLTTLVASPPPASRRTRATFTLGSGAFAWDETGLAIERGDSARWLRAELLSGERGAEGALEVAGRHVWGASARFQRGAHTLWGSFAQRGSGARLQGGEQQWARGESGAGEWRFGDGDRAIGLQFARGADLHRSEGVVTLPWSERRAGETRVGALARLAPLDGTVEWRRTTVARIGSGAFAGEADAVWGAVRAARAFGAGSGELALGAGWHEAIDAFELAPSLAWRSAWRGIAWRTAAGRVVTPVWSDLAPGEAAFTQRTWALSLDGDTAPGVTSRLRFGGGVVAGVTEGLAIARRLPFEELWLRSGFRQAADDYPFLLARATLAWEGGPFAARAEGQALAREPGAPRQDPNAAARVLLEWRLSLFDDDLGVRIGAIVEGVRGRSSERPDRPLPPDVSFGARAVLTLADATVAITARNLEDRRREDAWIDTATGQLARGPGRELRLSLHWRLSN